MVKGYTYLFNSDATQTFTVGNIGQGTSEPLQPLQVSGGGAHAVVSNDTCQSEVLGPFESCTFDVTFTAAPCTGTVGPLNIGVGGTSKTYLVLGVVGTCPS
jgi:hypothetical protein